MWMIWHCMIYRKKFKYLKSYLSWPWQERINFRWFKWRGGNSSAEVKVASGKVRVTEASRDRQQLKAITMGLRQAIVCENLQRFITIGVGATWQNYNSGHWAQPLPWIPHRGRGLRRCTLDPLSFQPPVCLIKLRWNPVATWDRHLWESAS